MINENTFPNLPLWCSFYLPTFWAAVYWFRTSIQQSWSRGKTTEKKKKSAVITSTGVILNELVKHGVKFIVLYQSIFSQPKHLKHETKLLLEAENTEKKGTWQDHFLTFFFILLLFMHYLCVSMAPAVRPTLIERWMSQVLHVLRTWRLVSW